MHRLYTYILLFIVVVGQLFGGSVSAAHGCTEVEDQRSVDARPHRSCNCSARAESATSCCGSKNEATCCGSYAQEPATTDASICACGCQHTSAPVPIQTDSSSKLLRLIYGASTNAVAPAPVLRCKGTREAGPQSKNFHSGLSAQPLYCSWLI